MNTQQLVAMVYRKEYARLDKSIDRRNVNSSDAEGRSLLMHAVLAEDADPAMVRFLVERGAAIDTHDLGQKWTALHFAARDQKTPIVRELLVHGASVDPVDVFGNTPLWRAVMNWKGDLNLIEILVTHGASPTLKNGKGVSSLDLAKNMGRDELAAFLSRNG